MTEIVTLIGLIIVVLVVPVRWDLAMRLKEWTEREDGHSV